MTTKLQVLLTRRMLVTPLLGFASGLPLLATSGTLRVWLTETGVDLTTIGLFGLVGLPYSLKFLWAPLMDRFTPPFLGRRRGWMVLSQLALLAALLALSCCNPAERPWLTAFCALLTALASASQDIVLDAHRRDTLPDEELGLGSSLFITGYRVGMLCSGALALWLSEFYQWQTVYRIIAGCVVLGLLTTLAAPEPKREAAPHSFREAVLDPFLEFFRRRRSIELLVFILAFKLGDSVAAAMLEPFILELGYSKENLAAVAKGVGMAATIGGGVAGGLLMLHIGINRALWIFGFLQALSTLGFALLSRTGHSLWALTAVIGFENISSGLGTAAFAAFLAALTCRKFSATQYALLSSLMGVPRVLLSAPSGYWAAQLGWAGFFTACAAAALPGMLLLLHVAPWPGSSSVDGSAVD